MHRAVALCGLYCWLSLFYVTFWDIVKHNLSGASRERYGQEPDGNAALAYDATMVLARAVAERGTDRAAIREYLAALGERGGHAGVTGTLRFLPSGDPQGRGVVMTRIHGGKLLVAEGR